MSNWQQYKQEHNMETKKQNIRRKPQQTKEFTEYQQKIQDKLNQRKQRKEKLLKQKQIDQQGVFQFNTQEPDKMKPIIVTYLTCKLQKLNVKDIYIESPVYVNFYSQQLNKIIYQSYILPKSQFEIYDIHKNTQNIDKKTILEQGKNIEDVRNEVDKIINKLDFFAGYRAKYLLQQTLNLQISSSHIFDLQYVNKWQQQDKSELTFIQLLVNSGIGYYKRFEPEQIWELVIQVYDKVKNSYDREVAQYFANKINK